MGPPTRARQCSYTSNSTIREFQRGKAHYLAKAREQPFLLLKDMAALKTVRQEDLFLSLKKDLALVSFSTHLTDTMLGYPFSYLITYSSVVSAQAIQEVFMAEE